MQNFDYQTPTRLIFGKGAVTRLPEIMARFGKKILLTYGGGSIKKTGLYDKVIELLSDFEIYELPGHTPGGIVLLLREDRILFTGDSVNHHLWMQLEGCAPLDEFVKMPFALRHYFKGKWIRNLTREF